MRKIGVLFIILGCIELLASILNFTNEMSTGIVIYNFVLFAICIVGAYIMFRISKNKKTPKNSINSQSVELETSKDKNLYSPNLLHICLVRDLITIAVADGNISPISEQNIKEIMKNKSIDANLYNEVLNTQPEKIQDAYPTSQDDKENYLFCLTYIMLKDKPSKRKKDYLLFVARKMQLSEEDVISIIDSVGSSPF